MADGAERTKAAIIDNHIGVIDALPEAIVIDFPAAVYPPELASFGRATVCLVAAV